MWNYNSDDPAVTSGAGALFVNGGIGAFNDINGERTWGFGAQGGLYKGDVKRNDANMGAELGIGTAQAGLLVNKKTASLGLQANGAELAANNIGTQEHNLRFGLSAGEGFGGRLHYGDADKDGVREMGFGFDLGPASFDMRSELLGYSFNMSRDIGRYALNVFGGLFD